MKKSNLFMAVAFVLAIGAALTSNAKTARFTIYWFKSDGVCTSGTIDQPLCAGSEFDCTIGGVSPVYASEANCQDNVNVLKYD